MRRGVTLPELLVVTILIGIVTAIAAPLLASALDRLAVREAAGRFAVLHETARQLAVARSRPVELALDTAGPAARLVVVRGRTARDTVAVRSLGRARMSTTQPVVTFGPLGFALGLSNTTVVMARGAFAETLTVSRTGRLKRW